MSAVKTRQKLVKKRSLHRVNEHFEQIFNEGLMSVIAFQQLAREPLNMKWSFCVGRN